jgi:hypothetical protein
MGQERVEERPFKAALKSFRLWALQLAEKGAIRVDLYQPQPSLPGWLREPETLSEEKRGTAAPGCGEGF